MNNACADDGLRLYYRWHSQIYDATRWSFLFGRARVIELTAQELGSRAKGAQIVEVGCGTGKNLEKLCRILPQAQILGIDLCDHMLARAVKKPCVSNGLAKVSLGAYADDSLKPESADAILFSYALSMFNPGFEAAIANAHRHLRPGGIIAVVDFEDSGLGWFKSWMRFNHVRMDKHILPLLDKNFTRIRRKISKAYAGVWNYFTFLGEK